MRDISSTCSHYLCKGSWNWISQLYYMFLLSLSPFSRCPVQPTLTFTAIVVVKSTGLGFKEYVCGHIDVVSCPYECLSCRVPVEAHWYQQSDGILRWLSHRCRRSKSRTVSLNPEHDRHIRVVNCNMRQWGNDKQYDLQPKEIHNILGPQVCVEWGTCFADPCEPNCNMQRRS